MVAKSFPRKRVPTKNFHLNFWCSQNNFLKNGSLPKIFNLKFFGRKFFYGRKIISSKTGPNKNFDKYFLAEDLIMVGKSFPRKRVPTKNFHQKFCLWSQNQFLENGSLQNFIINIFLENGSYQKFSLKIYNRTFFYGRKIISSKTGPYQKFSSKFFLLKIFYGRKIISSKTGPYQKFST